jgi:catechol 2,3-dioxygenase-like lactoylglutathione lyase family enzyme
MPPIRAVIETSLYVEDLNRSQAFYNRVMGLRVLSADQRLCALRVSDRQVLLLFKKGASQEAMSYPGGVIPGHDGQGRLHLGLAIDEADLTTWERHLEAIGVAIESRVHWPRGGRSLYFRDPDGHLLELLTPGVWAIY